MLIRALFVAAALAAPAHADPVIAISDGYARAASPVAKSGAAFMVIANDGDTDDRLIAVATDAAQRAEIHTHVMEDGIARMTELDDGLPIPAGGEAVMARGGDHLMLMGLTVPFTQGAAITLTLTFEDAGDIAITLPVDNARQP